MRKPEINYREFRLSRIQDPRFSHLKLLFGWVVYLVLFCLTEKLIPAESCYPISCIIDTWIPFCEIFIIPYVLWYALIIFSLGYFLMYRVENFKSLQLYFIIVQLTATVIYILFPNRQDLRPIVFPRENFLTQCVAVLYRIDTNTGVCPSLHVACSIGIASVWLREKTVQPMWKGCILALVILICLSTMFIKQHSALDFFAALPVCMLAEYIIFGRSKYRKAIG